LFILTLQTSTFTSYGGIPTYNRLVCQVLDTLGDRVNNTVLLGTDDPDRLSECSADLCNIQLEAFGGSRIALVRRLMQIATNRPIDLMLIGHVNYAPLGLVIRTLQPGLKYGVMVHGVDVWGKLSPLRRKAFQQADFIVSVSKYTQRRAVEANGVKDERFRLLPNTLRWSVDDEEFPEQQPTAAGIRLLTVCRLDETERYKGVDTVITALSRVLERVPDVHYWVVGEGRDSSRLKGLAGTCGVADRVHFLGSVNDDILREQYRSCDIFVMPSAKEGFGIVFLEAMRYGKAVVAADAGGSPEVVLDGVTGSLVPYGNSAQLADAITDLCINRDKRLRLGKAGYRRLRQEFLFDRFRENLTQIIWREVPALSLYKHRRRLVATTDGL